MIIGNRRTRSRLTQGTDFLMRHLASVCEDRDKLRQLCEKQAQMNLKVAKLALELDSVKAERDTAVKLLKDVVTRHGECDGCVHSGMCHDPLCDTEEHNNWTWGGINA